MIAVAAFLSSCDLLLIIIIVSLIVGGIATTDEMCLSFIVYYPRMNLTDCESELSTVPLLNTFGTLAIIGNPSFHPFHYLHSLHQPTSFYRWYE
jgi:hypothetical protein